MLLTPWTYNEHLPVRRALNHLDTRAIVVDTVTHQRGVAYDHQGFIYKVLSYPELNITHHIILIIIDPQIKYFKLKLYQPIKQFEIKSFMY